MANADLVRLAYVVLAVFLFYALKKFLKFLYVHIIGPNFYPVDFKSKGKWALVTGCTDGIGKEYAKQLASRGCDIILVSRSMDKLKATSSEIEEKYKVETKIIQADFLEDASVLYEKIGEGIKDLEIGVLVNNVGLSYDYPEYFLDLPNLPELTNNLVKANVISVTRMTALVMPGMVSRGKGIIINIGSLTSVIPGPLLTLYGATKAYVEKFTEELSNEYAKKGIIIQYVKPGLVCTNMSKISRTGLFRPSASTFVRSAIRRVGFDNNTTGYLPHTLFMLPIVFIERFISRDVSNFLVIRSMETTRSRALKRIKRQ